MRNIWTSALLGVLVFGVATVVGAQSKDPRFPSLKREQMTDAQKRVYDEIEVSRGGVRVLSARCCAVRNWPTDGKD